MKYVKSKTKYDKKCRVTPNIHETPTYSTHKLHIQHKNRRKHYNTVTEWLED